MKAVSNSRRTKPNSGVRPGKTRPHGELFLGYKALHELRILMRLASSPSATESKPDKSSY